MGRARLALVLTLAAAVAACDGGAATADAGPDASRSGVSGFTAVPHASNALAAFAEWQTPDPVVTDLAVACGSEYRARIRGDAPTTRHEVFVMGLWDGASCELVAQPDGAAARTTFTAGPIPDALPDLEVARPVTSPLEPGWTLFNLSNWFNGQPLTLVLVDERGRYRWYHEVATDGAGSDTDVRPVAEGVLTGGGAGGPPPMILSWHGSRVWEERFWLHHHIQTYESSRQILYLSHTSDCPGNVGSGTVNIWDRELGENTWTWKICDHYTPTKLVHDWDHINTIEPFPGEDAFLLSLRDQNLLMKVDRDTEEIVWTLGAGAEIDADGDAEFLNQHAPEIQPDGTILMFDNGAHGTREYSRAIEIAYDESTGEADLVWSFRPNPDIFAPIWGDADQLAGGNRLVVFGRRGERANSHIIEVTRAGDVAWHLRLPESWGVYRAHRMDPIHGYAMPPTSR